MKNFFPGSDRKSNFRLPTSPILRSHYRLIKHVFISELRFFVREANTDQNHSCHCLFVTVPAAAALCSELEPPQILRPGGVSVGAQQQHEVLSFNVSLNRSEKQLRLSAGDQVRGTVALYVIPPARCRVTFKHHGRTRRAVNCPVWPLCLSLLDQNSIKIPVYHPKTGHSAHNTVSAWVWVGSISLK